MKNYLNPVVAAAKHYPLHFIRHLVWWGRLSFVDVGQNVRFHLPLRISGNGKLRFDSGCIVGKSVSITACPRSITIFHKSCSIGDGCLITSLSGANATFSERVSIHANCQLAIANNWELGADCTIESSCMISAREKDPKGNFVVGKGSCVGNLSLIDTTGGVIIGDDVAIGPSCIFYTHDHEPARTGDAVWKGNIKSGAIQICNGAWIGARVTILPGVCIGERAIVGAGAVVTKDVPPDALAMGVPAKVVKRLRS